MLLFGEEERCFRLFQGLLIDVSGVREHPSGGWPEACDERLIGFRHQRQEYGGDHAEEDGHDLMDGMCPDTRVAAACTKGMPVSPSP